MIRHVNVTKEVRTTDDGKHCLRWAKRTCPWLDYSLNQWECNAFYRRGRPIVLREVHDEVRRCNACKNSEVKA